MLSNLKIMGVCYLLYMFGVLPGFSGVLFSSVYHKGEMLSNLKIMGVCYLL